MQVSAEQLRGISYAHDSAEHQGREAMGRAAFEVSCKIALAAPTEDEIRKAHSGVGQEDGTCIVAVKRLIANRLASLTARPDPAVEAVLALIKTDGEYAVCVAPPHVRKQAEEIVAAVDQARGRK